MQFDPLACIKECDYKKAIKPSNVKINYELLIDILQEVRNNDLLKRFVIIRSIIMLLCFFFNLIYSTVKVFIKRKLLAYYIVCLAFSLIGSFAALCKLVIYSLEYRKNVVGERYRLREGDRKATNTALEGSENDVQHQSPERRSLHCSWEILKTKPFMDLLLEVLVQIVIYPIIICRLYSLINEKSLQFDDAFAVFNFIVLLCSLYIDVVETKLKCIYLVQKVILCWFCEAEDNWKVKLTKC